MKKKNYLAQLNEVLSWAHPRLAKAVPLDFKNCFGAVAGYVDGNIFVSWGKFGIALKLPQRILKDLLQDLV